MILKSWNQNIYKKGMQKIKLIEKTNIENWKSINKISSMETKN